MNFFRISIILIKVRAVSGLFEPFYAFLMIFTDISEGRSDCSL